MNRALTGAVAHHAGLAAEAGVARHYQRRGLRVEAHRWRGRGGEIDLIARDGGEIVFVEVKKSRSMAAAAAHLSQRQMRRLQQAALEYLVGEPAGQNTPMRFDVALVDAMGRIEVLENAIGH